MSILKAIGNTPLIEIKNIWKSDKVRIFAKYEGANPGGSIKDRVALQLIREAETTGELTKDKIILEASSGNTGIGLAMVAVAKGYRCTIVMPKSVSVERAKTIQAFGADVVFIDGNTDDAIGFVDVLMKGRTGQYFYNPNQFDNEANYFAHLFGTGNEIIQQLVELCYWSGHYPYMNPTHFISAIGTTGTIRGCALAFNNNYLWTKRISPQEAIRTKIIAVSPQKNSKIQGLKNLQFQTVPKIYDKSVIDETIQVMDKDAFNMTRRLAREEGIFCGMSSGAAIFAAIAVAKTLKDGIIVVILPDRGNNYLSTGVFD